jgi:hypothetical protein
MIDRQSITESTKGYKHDKNKGSLLLHFVFS